jgi:uncharacterized protein YdaU (DUF1376 family)
MAALPYMQLYVADYLADTMHLSAEEHGAYLLLIMNYWQTGKPINEKHISCITKIDKEKVTDVIFTLQHFFNIDSTGLWHHKRIDEELEKVRKKSVKTSLAGKKSAEKRWGSNEKVTDVITDVKSMLQHNCNHTDTDTDTDTDNIYIPKTVVSVPYEKIVNLYQETLPSLPGVAKITDERKKKIKKIWISDPGIKNLDDWKEYFNLIKTRKFLMGESNGSIWKANLDFLIEYKRFIDIVEGKYS